MLYFNQAGTSWPKPLPVRDAVQTALDAPVETWAHRFEAQHLELARAFGITDENRLLLTPGATTALSVGIQDHPWEPGDRVLVSGFEHHALYRPAQQLAERGVEVGVIPPGDGGPVAMGALADELRRGGVRLVAMTAASNVTGDLLPAAEIVQLAHEHGSLALIDAAQIAGWIPIDVAEMDVDLLAFTAHKALQAPWGLGGLYVAERVQMNSPAAACELPTPGELSCATMPGYCDVGSVDRAALAGAVAALRWLAGAEQSDRLERARRQVGVVCEILAELPKVRLHGFSELDSRLPTVAITVEGRSPLELASALSRRGMLVASGLQCAPLAHETLGTQPEGVLRISFGPGNGDGDEESLASALREVLIADEGVDR